jgi:hypothetical protein
MTSAVLSLAGTRGQLARLNVGRCRVDVEHDPVDIRRDRRVRVINDKCQRFRARWRTRPVQGRARARSVACVTSRNNAPGEHRACHGDFDRRVPRQCGRSPHQPAAGLCSEQQASGRDRCRAPGGQPGAAATPVHASLHPFVPAALRALMQPITSAEPSPGVPVRRSYVFWIGENGGNIPCRPDRSPGGTAGHDVPYARQEVVIERPGRRPGCPARAGRLRPGRA